ncbi:PAS domain S-box protein [Alteriqipengyuania sp. WL0013]|uniref:PAS domain S-box protein n=1 Tax=Alteriqipengyuania sp. WL0013 TaxID=3110773 RepID=UPI002C9FD8E6|nr:PAS domain S-box protein [Alteriqipengyuania sp. WL0013]MEB3415933.1 PAS domain S-box protein [Alteriqipengyuania sp. WL0013]
MVHFLPDVDLPNGIRSLFEKSRASLTIADLDREDAPLIGLNQAFLDICGYSAEESLGKNCRFLQPETGGGPVRARIREFLYESDEPEERFVIPNVTKGGDQFLNLVYMGRLNSRDGRKLVIASQFAIDADDYTTRADYEAALESDLVNLKAIAEDSAWVMLGSYHAIASSHRLIAEARLDE